MVARAYDLIHGRMGLVEVAREFRKYKTWLRLEDDHDLLLFDAICSDTSHLPFGSTRKFWNKEALAIKDQELRIIESRFRDRALEAARNIVARYESRRDI